MRPLAPADQPQDPFSRAADHDDDAPLAAVSDTRCFWDHLGATRAEEYAAEDILPGMPAPLVPPAPAPGLARLDDMPDTTTASLHDVLEAHDLALLDPPAPDPSGAMTSPVALAAGEGLDLPEAHLPPVAPFIAESPRRRGRRRRGTSRLGYRLQRIWLTPLYRMAIKLGTPIAIAALGLALYFSDDARRATVVDAVDAARAAFVERPEFMVTTLQLPEVSPELEAALKDKLDLSLPESSFRLDLDALRASLEELDWVRSADLRLMSEGVLSVTVTERVPAILWRSEEGLELLDAEGVRVAFATYRGARPDLPLIAGKGAETRVAEALDILDAAAPLGERLRGLVRMGERRWDVVLDRDQRIKLPERGTVAALERVIALDQAQDLLARDLVAADLRNPARPVLQISAGALDTLRAIRSQSME